MAKLPFKISVEKTVKDREFETLSETERLKLEILRLKERNEYLETENIILKKKIERFAPGKRCCHNG